MLLKDYIPNVDKKFRNTFFSGISFDSRSVKKNNIFFAIKGNEIDGNKFIPLAIKKGSKIIVSEKKFKKKHNGIIYLDTDNIRKLLADVTFKIYKKKPENLIAVTGTNGKSSIANFYYQILKLNKKKVASIGTLGVKANNFNLKLNNTTIDPIKLGKIFKILKDKNIDNVIMEASSHGLSQNRLDGLVFNTGIFTNISQDHLDYHKNFKNYLKAKLYLFENLIKKKGNVITDDEIGPFKKIKRISVNENLKLYTLNNNKSNFQVLSHFFKNESQILRIKYKNLIEDINLKLIGKIQLKNLLMAIIAAEKSGLELRKILKVIPKLISTEGRFEKIGNIKNKAKVILDYAHTPDALKVCLLNLREQFPNKKIILLFGCGGNRDQNKRSKMGKIAAKYSNLIYLTDDNPRFENPDKIRRDIKKGIKNKKVVEISNRATAISDAIKNLSTGEILLVAGRGHEKIQDFGKKKINFSDKIKILKAIKSKNLSLSNDFKVNIIRELSNNKKLPIHSSISQARINSKEVKKNDIFFAIKGKKIDANNFVAQAFKKKASLAIVNKIQSSLNKNKQIKIKNSLKLLTDASKIFRKNINTKIIGITGSCGKTTLKELVGNSLKKISQVSISPKSYNNKYGVPLSLFNLRESDDYGVLELGMDKKGEIDYLSKILQPNVSVITNINYAHAKNFKNIKGIALAKSEIIHNTQANGHVILNADDRFFKFHQNIALKKNLNVISFGIKNRKSDVKFTKIKKNTKNFQITIEMNNLRKNFTVLNNFQSNIYNTLSALAIISVYVDIFQLDERFFLNFKIPSGRGNLLKVKIKKKTINLIDETYNSNPLSLKSAILNYDKIDSKGSKKYLLIGDMLELGRLSNKLHQSIVPTINMTKVDKVFVKGKKAQLIFKKLNKSKRGKVLKNKQDIIKLIKNRLNNNDYLMIKASNATGFNKIVRNLKGLN
ncbi:UDP-N-acetylmuramoyl-L-alanyl-D-glutamate--2,6-diaminopimelate ligase [Candidatus Pelagibacter sp.]|nr:UDP-N-acetylmuramoyl-L-alanyl-D-glutamate--2,6-diaminopimelate ligase [Candidatus Pelagibacter sp.]